MLKKAIWPSVLDGPVATVSIIVAQSATVQRSHILRILGDRRPALTQFSVLRSLVVVFGRGLGFSEDIFCLKTGV